MTAANRAVLQPLVRLIPLLVHDAATIRTKEYAGEQAPLRHSGWGRLRCLRSACTRSRSHVSRSMIGSWWFSRTACFSAGFSLLCFTL